MPQGVVYGGYSNDWRGGMVLAVLFELPDFGSCTTPVSMLRCVCSLAGSLSNSSKQRVLRNESYVTQLDN
jgi:hypothetical protein